MTRRSGVTLTEVLVALFIMAIGILAILTLFPAGLITMGQALKDDRTTQCANQANAYMRWYWKEYCIPGTDTFPSYMNSPDGTPSGSMIVKVDQTVAGPSYPILIDPMGAYGTASNTMWMGDSGQGNGTNQTNIRRLSLSLITSSQLALRTCSLLDSFGFDDNGAPMTGADMRTLPYNWAWLLQRKDNREQSIVELTAIVYDKRVSGFSPSASEKVYTPVSATVGQSSVSFPSNAAPPVQKGQWILDASVTNIITASNTAVVPATGDSSAGRKAGVRNANFYRVVSATLNPTTGNVDIELQTPLKDASGDSTGFIDPVTKSYLTDPSTGLTYGRFVLMNGLYEVFELPPLSNNP